MINYPSLESIRKLIDLLAFPILCILVPFPTFASREGEKKRKGREEDPCRDFSIERFRDKRKKKKRKRKKKKKKLLSRPCLGYFSRAMIYHAREGFSRACRKCIYNSLRQVLQLLSPPRALKIDFPCPGPRRQIAHLLPSFIISLPLPPTRIPH